MKKHHLLFTALFVLAACSNDSPEPERHRANTQLAGNLFGIEYDDYDFDAGVAYYNRHMPHEKAACSEVRKGNFVGRNLDYYINRNASAIIKMNAGEKRFASIGVVGCSSEFTSDLAASGEFDSIYMYLPCRTTDGINENGVYIGVNIMPTGETSLDSTTWVTDEWGHSAYFTNTASDTAYCVMYLNRFVLDNARSVDHALELIESVSWYDPVDYPSKDHTQAFHWMLADEERNCILEFLDNKLVVTDAKDLKKPSSGTVMTNFTNAVHDEGLMQISGIGYERYDILTKYYDSIPETFSGMEDLMKKVWYSHFYNIEPGSDDFWLSEFASAAMPSWLLYKNSAIWDVPAYSDAIKAAIGKWNDSSLWYVEDTPLWFTVHTSIYDLKARKLHMLPHEGRGGVRTYQDFDLNSSFDKPLAAR